MKINILDKSDKIRGEHLRQLISDNVKQDYHVLEIGSWTGYSTVVLAEACRNKGTVYCIDSWLPYQSASKEANELLLNGVVFRKFQERLENFNIINVCVLRGKTDDMLPKQLESFFDFIYIDGDHTYSQFSRDFNNSWRILKKGGVLCGDDYELRDDQVALKGLNKFKEHDYIKDRKTRKYYHPGITYFLKDYKDQITVQNGFWYMIKCV